ncbi:DNA polymerase III subunit alpha [Spirillospora sp. NBC_01491]|uniref:DNA polymerase III subunit alpha n=1 Tax=Spirillospora sp. NBC_01491 TaxID=2976007 RepID=UPI002E371BCE|nr:DNA polymerase III subunit alpha [Spirillospora sp. NBC_01491]
MSDSYVHLHVHTEYSMLDGAAKIKPLVGKAAELGMPAVAMSDHGNMFGSYEFYKAARGSDIKPIIGIEAYVAPESRHVRKPIMWGEPHQKKTNEETGEGGDVSASGSYLHKTMWAKDSEGLRNLFKIASLASLEGHYRKWPRMDDELLATHGKGIIATTGCPSGAVQTRLRLGQFDEALKAAAKYQDIFGKENYFLELMDHGLPLERRVREDLLKISKELGIPPLVTNDSHYVTEDQAQGHDALLCVGTGSQIADPARFRFSGSGYYLKTADEMRALDASDAWQEGCRNTLLVAEMVSDYDAVFANRDLAAKFPVPDGETESSWLRKEAERGAVGRYGAQVPAEVTERINYELGVIDEMGFPGYFLVVADICNYARDNGIWLGPGRGSATGSMVSYVTGITELDPIEHGLIFERFLNPERVSMPDVDLDFDDRQRDRMIQYVTERYGRDNVSLIITYMTIKSKAAVKDSCRIHGLPFALGDRITKAFPPAAAGKEIPLSAIFDDKHPRHGEAGELRQLYSDDVEVKRVMDTAVGIEGLTRGTGVHAAGVILSSEPLIEVMPIHQRQDDGARITGFDGPSCEEIGCLKMDFLGLRNLTILGDAVANVKANRGIELEMSTLPMDDAKTYELLRAGWTLGIFQLDSTMMRDLTKLMAPTEFEDVSAVLALGRPGPMGANAHTNYALRKAGQQETTPIHPELAEVLEPILGSTHGLVVYQEQVMAIAQQLAGYTLGGADILRRAMGKKKKEEMDRQWAIFSKGMADKGYTAQAAQAVWDVLVPFSQYGFNKSHTAGYGLVSYWTAYMKANYPAEYMAALLTSVGDNKDKMAVYLGECRRMKVKVLPPDVNESVAMFAAVGNDIRFGLNAIRNVGDNVVAGIMTGRTEQGPYTDFTDFLSKVTMPVCNKRAIESLIKAGAFDSLGHRRRALLLIHEPAVDSVISEKKNAAIGQDSLFGGLDEPGGSGSAATVTVPDADEWDKGTLLTFEREMLGLYVSSHPLDGAERILERNRDASTAEIGAGGREGTVRLSGLISGLDRKVTKQGNTWAIIKLEDLEGSLEVLFFPKVYQLHAPDLAADVVISVLGRINDRDGSISVHAQEMEVLDVSGPTGKDSPVVITIAESRVTEPATGELRRVLKAHPGEAPVHMLLRRHGGRKNVLMNLEPFQVQPGPALFGDLKSLFGAGAVSQ